ncbi:MAG: hypothetical protein AAGF60_10490 [Pseudomonadota bacterium]
MPRYFIHAGAHRTGSSSFQMCLYLNRDALKAAGFDVAYPGRDGAPQGTLDMRFPSPRHGDGPHPGFTQKTRRIISQHSSGPDGSMILSEENIPGRMLHFQKGQFFPKCETRLRVLKDALKGPVARLVYVLRDYANLYASAYRKRAEDTAVDPWDGAVTKFMGMDRGWPEIVEMLRDILQPEAFEVVPYTARGSSRDLLYRLAPEAGAGWVEPERTVNLSPSDAALEEIQAQFAAGKEPTPQDLARIVAAHRDTPRSGFAEFTAEQQAELDARYNTDLLRIGEMKGVSLAPAPPL